MSLSYKTFGNRIYVTNLAAGGILKLQESGFDVTLIRLDDNTVDLSYLKKDTFYSFSDLNEDTQVHVVFKQIDGNLNQDNIEFLNDKQDQTLVYLDNIEPEIAISSIKFIFNQFKEKIQKNNSLSPVEKDFYINFSKDSKIKFLPITNELRSLIVKYTGESSFIREQFAGLEEFFSFDKFLERINVEVQNLIDEGVKNNEYLKLNEEPFKTDNLFTILDSNFHYRLDDERDGILSLLPSRLRETKTGQMLVERAGWKTTYNSNYNKPMNVSIAYSELKYVGNSQTTTKLYQNATNFNEITLVEISNPGNRQEIREVSYQPKELKDIYNPEEEKKGLSWFISKISSSKDVYNAGPADIALAYYIKFTNIFSDENNFIDKQTNKLKYAISEWEIDYIEQAANDILLRAAIYQENLIRYNLAEIVSRYDKEDLKGEENAANALEIAQAAADLNLQGMEGDFGDEELTEEDIQQRVQFYKQCVLLLNAEDLKQDHKKSIITNLNIKDMHKGSYYNNRFYMVESKEDNLSIKNKLISPSGSKIKPFMEITPDIMSALKPRLRIYKIYQVRDKGDSTNKKTVSFEFPFPSYTNSTRAMTFNGQEIDRGDGLGIKSFNFSFDGETPATSQQYISADLSLFFQSFSDFVKERVVPGGRSDGEEEKFRYVDLFVNTKSCPQDLSSTSPLNYDPQYYRIRVDVGWEPREDSSFEQILQNRGLNSTEFNEALAVMNKSFYLNLVDHEINISDSGTVTISANYIAYIEGIMENNNVLLSAEAKQLQDEFVGKYEAERRKKNCDKDELAELRASINAIRISSRNILHQSLIEKLVKNGCMYYTQVRNKSRRDFTSRKFFHKKPDLLDSSGVAYRASIAQGNSGSPLEVARNLVDGCKSTKENYKYIMKQFLTDQKQNNMERVSFFYLSDLIYFLLDPIYVDGEPEEQIKVILSSFSIEIPFTGDVSLNIGQIPIEIEVFTKWYKDEIVDKELDSISFLEFIKRLTFYLITDIFSEVCVDKQQHKRLSFMNAAVNSVKNGGKGVMEKILTISANSNEPIAELDPHYASGLLPLPTSALNQERLKPSDFVQYLLIYPHHRPETHVGRAMALEDARRGVHHLYIGANKGILKNASFSKTDIQYLRESRMLTQGENGLLQLSSLYRANLKMIGNTIFYPGMLLYLNPFGFGGMDFGLPHQGPGTTEDPNLSNIMGIGGYQKVVKVSSTISESGKFETDVECIFEHTGEPPRENADNQERSPGQRSGSDQQDIRKITCSDLDPIDAAEGNCKPTDISKDLQNQLLKLNKQGTIDDRGTTE